MQFSELLAKSSDSSRTATRESGFTLVELLTVVMILAVLMTLAAPSFKELILTQRLKTLTSELQMSLFMARNEAIKRATAVAVVPTGGDWRNGWVVCVDTNENAACDSGEVVIEKMTPPSTVNVAAMTGSAIVFRRDGRLSSGSATIKAYTSDNAAVSARCVIIDLSGRPSVANGSVCG